MLAKQNREIDIPITKKIVDRAREKKMYVPPPNITQFEVEADLKIREQERKRNYNTYAGDVSDPLQRKQLSRRAYVLLQLTVILLIIVGLVILYHLAY